MKKLIYFVLISIASVVLYTAEAFLGIFSHPNSGDLISFYSSHKNDLNKVVSMIKTDQVSSVVSNWNISENQMTNERWNAYRSLLSDMEGVHGIIKHNYGYYIEMSHSKSGATAKGLAYFDTTDLESEPCCLMVFSLLSNEKVAYKSISENWYIYYLIMTD